MTLYQKFVKLSADLSAIGLEQREGGSEYFCTPKGARAIGWTGVDGIHFCFIRDYGEMVFSVSPMNLPEDGYVRPVAATFEDFIRLLLACGSVDAIEQAWMMDKVKFDAYLSDNRPNEKQKEVLDRIEKELELSPLKDPYEYIRYIQEDFDGSRIPYSKEYYDTLDLPVPEEKEVKWKVYYDGNFWGHHGRDRAGKEIGIKKTFEWEGEHWYIPAVYACSKGLVIDFCMSASKKRINAFLEKYTVAAETADSDELEELSEKENPLNTNFRAVLTVNGKEIRQRHGCAVSFLPDECIPIGERGSMEAELLLKHYGLDDSCGWAFRRVAFPWATKSKPVLRSLKLHMEKELVSVSSVCFETPSESKQIKLIHPNTGEEYVLEIVGTECGEMPQNAFGDESMEYPAHYTELTYTLSPELPAREFCIRDCHKGDSPRRKAISKCLPESDEAVAIGIIGGADGPTAILLSSGKAKPRGAVSSLHFEKCERLTWKTFFRYKPKQDVEVVLK